LEQHAFADELPRSIKHQVAGRAVSPIFIGRTEQLGRAAQVLDRAQSRESHHILIAGEAGVGKTRFTKELAQQAEERGFRILRGACVSIGGMGLPFARSSEPCGMTSTRTIERRSPPSIPEPSPR
jgi:transcriptional regulator with AAA-type ATPase domain